MASKKNSFKNRPTLSPPEAPDLEAAVRDLIAASGRATPPYPKAPITPAPLALDPATGKVRAQYEELPYPYRDPKDDLKKLSMTFMDDMQEVNATCYRGRRRFNRPFRALVAGGGAGDSTVFLAAQLRAVPHAEIVYVDLSLESQRITRERLHNQSIAQNDPRVEQIVTLHQASLLDVAELGVGTFDYINCSGVLHHLADPLEGLLALKKVLKPDGAMGIMVYGKIGRTSIYPIQDLLRIFHDTPEKQADSQRRIDDTKLLLENLPATNLHRINGRWIDNMPDAEVFDLFLHSRDRAYSLPELYAWIESAGLYLSDFAPTTAPAVQISTFPHKLPASLKDRIAAYPPLRQAAILELLHGDLNTFEFYLTRQPESHCEIKALDAVPFFGLIAKNEKLPRRILAHRPGQPNPEVKIQTSHNPIYASVEMASPNNTILRLIDNKRTVSDILAELGRVMPGYDQSDLAALFYERLQPLIDLRLIRFRHISSNLDHLFCER